MTHAQLVRRLTALVSNIENVRRRLDALSKDAEPQDRASKRPAKRGDGRSKANGARRRSTSGPSCIGKTVSMGGVSVKIVSMNGPEATVQLKRNGRVKGKEKKKGAKVKISASHAWNLIRKSA